MRLPLLCALSTGLAFTSLVSQASPQPDPPSPTLSAREVFYSAETTTVTPAKATAGAPVAPKHPIKKPTKKTQDDTAVASNKDTAAPPAASDTTSAPADSATGTVQLASMSSRSNYPPLGLKYSVLRVGDDSRKEPIDSDTVFHSNDHIELTVEVNAPGYLYVVTRGASGRWSTLYPAAGDEQAAAYVEPRHVYAIPPGQVITFSDPAGKEELFLFLSRKPVQSGEDLMLQLSNGPGTMAPAKAPQKKSDTFAHYDAVEAFNRMDDSAIGQLRTTYSRDLIVEKMHGTEAPTASVPDAPAKDTSVYVVDPSGRADAHVVADIAFQHE